MRLLLSTNRKKNRFIDGKEANVNNYLQSTFTLSVLLEDTTKHNHSLIKRLMVMIGEEWGEGGGWGRGYRAVTNNLPERILGACYLFHIQLASNIKWYQL